MARCEIVAALLTGRVIALDASVFVYQFRSAIPEINNRNGENINVLQGLFHLTVSLLQNGIKPVYVFDGKPPELKRAVLEKRAMAAGRSKESVLGGPAPQQLDRDLQTLLTHLGVPFIKAPCEAEATCAALVTSGRAWGAATEDMDILPFGGTRMLRHLKADKKLKVEEYNLPKILDKLNMTKEQFVDLCILLGCDYVEKIKGLGPKTALQMMRKHGSIEGILGAINRQKYDVPPEFHYEEARRLFLDPAVADVRTVPLNWANPDEEGLVRFLTHEKHMKEKRVRGRMEKFRAAVAAGKKRKSRPGSVPGRGGKQRKMNEFYPVTKSGTGARPHPGSSCEVSPPAHPEPGHSRSSEHPTSQALGD
ncbi:putative flap endonuclease 1 homolog [Ascaphus truei]|uniref:putative flap endonuclease 1 homolog n=1 Tax=Ascaphus truei TaxID=8439 RepID=UPI003F5AD73C